MSHSHPHPQRQYGNNYKASDDPRDHQNKRVTSDPSRNRARDFSRDYPYDGMSRYKHHDGPQLPVPSMKVGIPEDYRYTPPRMGPMEAENDTPAQMAATSADNTRQPRRPAEGFEPFSRRPGEPTRRAPKVNRDSFEHPDYGYPLRRGIKPLPAPRANRLWTHDEEAELLRYIIARRNWGYMAERIGRSPGSCESHWMNVVSWQPQAQGVKYRPL